MVIHGHPFPQKNLPKTQLPGCMRQETVVERYGKQTPAAASIKMPCNSTDERTCWQSSNTPENNARTCTTWAWTTENTTSSSNVAMENPPFIKPPCIVDYQIPPFIKYHHLSTIYL
jgi:hypothetical protein